MNRRNLLKGIGAAAVGGGAIVGSGALTQVSADRTATVSTASDSSANIELSASSTDFATTSTGTNGQTVLELDFSGLNDDAQTTVDPAFTITNNLSDGVGVTVNAYDNNGNLIETGVDIVSSSNGHDLTSPPSASSDDHNLDPATGTDPSVQAAITIDTTNTDPTTINTIEVTADTSAYQ